MSFMEMLDKEQLQETENGALGYTTTGKKLVDLNFKIPSFRNGIDSTLFDLALKQDKELTLRWLLYLRDVREGVGERKSFRDFMVHFANNHEELANKFFDVVPIEEYGRWDDYIYIYDKTVNKSIKHLIACKIRKQMVTDLDNYLNDKPISLLTKWLPSSNASSAKTRKLAHEMMKILGNISEKDYRKTLSALRKYLEVVEVKMSANEWHDIDYECVPSKANLNYSNAFMEHDGERREEYLEALEKGERKINAQAMFLHDMVHKYFDGYGWCIKPYDKTIEQLWKAQEKVDGFTNTIVVRDGSSSMGCHVGNSNVTALEVADAISLYCAENNTGEFKDKIITFSAKAKLIDVSTCKKLHTKLKKLRRHDECENTNIESVFDLILKTAVNNKVAEKDMPKSVLILSD